MIIFVKMKDKSLLHYEVCDACEKPIGIDIKKGHIKYVVIKKASPTGIKVCAECKRKKEKKNEK
jgi:RNA polymerase-binding transcription factor DksA